jgi:hypothetical protein
VRVTKFETVMPGGQELPSSELLACLIGEDYASFSSRELSVVEGDAYGETYWARIEITQDELSRVTGMKISSDLGSPCTGVELSIRGDDISISTQKLCLALARAIAFLE